MREALEVGIMVTTLPKLMAALGGPGGLRGEGWS